MYHNIITLRNLKIQDFKFHEMNIAFICLDHPTEVVFFPVVCFIRFQVLSKIDDDKSKKQSTNYHLLEAAILNNTWIIISLHWETCKYQISWNCHCFYLLRSSDFHFGVPIGSGPNNLNLNLTTKKCFL